MISPCRFCGRPDPDGLRYDPTSKRYSGYCADPCTPERAAEIYEHSRLPVGAQTGGPPTHE